VRWRISDPEGFDKWMERETRGEWMATDFGAETKDGKRLFTRWFHPEGGEDLVVPGDPKWTRWIAERHFRQYPDALLLGEQMWMKPEEFEALTEVA